MSILLRRLDAAEQTTRDLARDVGALEIGTSA